jgi:signal transduction histidine kinase
MEDKILLVDDEKDVRDVLNVSLADLGYEVFEAEDGNQALKIFKKVNPSIVLTDIKMPGMDGIDLLRKVKHEDPDTEVIMITGHGAMDLAIMSLKYEAADFISKPINVEALEVALKKVQEKILMRQKLKEYTENLERLVREKTELQSHLSTLGLMISSISHGLKGLLTGLDGGIYLLDSGFAKDNQERIREGWEVVKLMVDRIRKMIEDILFYAKERDLKWERLNVLDFATEVTTGMEPKMKAQNIEFIKDFDSKLGEFEVDASYVQSALINILENAVDACSRERAKKAHKIVFGIRKRKDKIIFEISDNGIGMDSETREKLFTPFFSTKENKGTGLGLFISNTAIEKHGGEIIVKSTPGQGTLFQIMIPERIQKAAKAFDDGAVSG